MSIKLLKVFKYLAMTFLIISTILFWGWLAVVWESDIPIFSPYHYSPTPFTYQMTGEDRTVLEFKAGILNDKDAALKVSEFYDGVDDDNSRIYWLYKSAHLGNEEAKKRLRHDVCTY